MLLFCVRVCLFCVFVGWICMVEVGGIESFSWFKEDLCYLCICEIIYLYFSGMWLFLFSVWLFVAVVQKHGLYYYYVLVKE